jgi:hypothetical protein
MSFRYRYTVTVIDRRPPLPYRYHTITLPLHPVTLPLHPVTLPLHPVTLPLHPVTHLYSPLPLLTVPHRYKQRSGTVSNGG